MSDGTKKQGIRRWIWTLVRLSVTIACLAYVINLITWRDRLIVDGKPIEGWAVKVDGESYLKAVNGEQIPIPADADQPEAPIRFVPGIISIFAGIQPSYLVAAVFLMSLTILLGGIRWQWLLQSHDLDPGAWDAIRLTWMGYLSNNLLPGSTGGDLVKAFSIARRTPGKRTSAVMTVLLDRVIGLVALMVAGAVSVGIKAAQSGFDSTGQLVLTMLGAVIIGGMVFFSRRIRSLLRVSMILDRIPLGQQIKKIDESLFHYRNHKMQLVNCLGIGLVIWLCTILGIYLLGLSIDVQAGLLEYFICLPVIFSAGAVVPAIAGLGVLEGLFQHFFGMVGVSASSAVALCLLYRLSVLVVSVPGVVPLYQELFRPGTPQTIIPMTDDTSGGEPIAAAKTHAKAV